VKPTGKVSEVAWWIGSKFNVLQIWYPVVFLVCAGSSTTGLTNLTVSPPFICKGKPGVKIVCVNRGSRLAVTASSDPSPSNKGFIVPSDKKIGLPSLHK